MCVCACVCVRVCVCVRDSLSELHSTLCERRLGRTVMRPTLLPLRSLLSFSIKYDVTE